MQPARRPLLLTGDRCLAPWSQHWVDGVGGCGCPRRSGLLAGSLPRLACRGPPGAHLSASLMALLQASAGCRVGSCPLTPTPPLTVMWQEFQKLLICPF